MDAEFERAWLLGCSLQEFEDVCRSVSSYKLFSHLFEVKPTTQLKKWKAETGVRRINRDLQAEWFMDMCKRYPRKYMPIYDELAQRYCEAFERTEMGECVCAHFGSKDMKFGVVVQKSAVSFTIRLVETRITRISKRRLLFSADFAKPLKHVQEYKYVPCEVLVKPKHFDKAWAAFLAPFTGDTSLMQVYLHEWGREGEDEASSKSTQAKRPKSTPGGSPDKTSPRV